MLTTDRIAGPFDSQPEASQAAVGLAAEVADVIESAGSFWAADRSRITPADLPAGAVRHQSYFRSRFGFYVSTEPLAPGATVASGTAGGEVFFDLASPMGFERAHGWGELRSLEGGSYFVYLVEALGSVSADSYLSESARRADELRVLATIAEHEATDPHDPWDPVKVADALADMTGILDRGLPLSVPGAEAHEVGQTSAEQIAALGAVLDQVGMLAGSEAEVGANVIGLMLLGADAVIVVELAGQFWAAEPAALRRVADLLASAGGAMLNRVTIRRTEFGLYGCTDSELTPGRAVGGTHTDAANPHALSEACAQAVEACGPQGGTPTVYLVRSVGSPLPDPLGGVWARKGPSSVVAKLWSGPTLVPAGVELAR